MAKYLLVDTLNTFYRARHMAPRRSDAWTKIGFALHITLSIVNKSFQKEGADHVVFCTEGRSWRKEVYEPYKKNRQVLRDKKTVAETEEDEEFFEAYKEFLDYIREKSNCTLLHCDIAEADDLIARWIAQHPDDENVILSSDSDFVQLINPNTHIYNGINNHLITTEGYFDDNGHRVKQTIKARDAGGNLIKEEKMVGGKMKKVQVMTKEEKPAPDVKWALFEKCMRGDTSDNIFSAYPGVRTKGSSKSIGLEEAFADMDNRGFKWNNMMLQRWTDHNDVEHRVLDDYNRNVELVDLTAQPESIKEYIDESIASQLQAKNVPHAGREFLRFCGKYDLNKLADFTKQYTQWLGKNYE